MAEQAGFAGVRGYFCWDLWWWCHHPDGPF